jgi:hypothetical protein
MMPKQQKYDAITREDKRTLYNEFFTIKEITDIDSALTPDGSIQKVDINNKAWKAVRKRRKEAVKKLRNKGFNDTQIRNQYNRKTRMKGAPTPFDLLKVEYPDTKKTADYIDKEKAIREKIKKFYGQDYFSKVAIKNPKYKAVSRPYLPKVKRSRN